ncbi:hypothetical protein CRI77_00335 [Mycolicibacterium duvalii]|uniref:Uncharacterized protein n=1 Tax=Mycolicibacterium duvalii TaxID=39688 RepID=A0A7I7K5E6_9MYCO|nr:hypothetical protein [Mycolicibacterium duvalii]MCV7368849.1 hypothetical protein [Mycolicibacterium duvalii]PEG44351.1 hypothetical protein CRI77_00335 [Mycolicibacterium duvalii]BBX19253.1 hypothetical protein MDUV_41130 [Mycolicibacterium duvalii]
MPDDEQEPQPETGVFSGFGVASAVLGVVAVVAVAVGVWIWSGHRAETAEIDHRTAVLQTAAEWTGVLVNMNKDTVDADLAALHEGTVGQLNVDFEASVEPFRRLVQTLQSRTSGQVNSVSLEEIHHEQPDDRSPDGGPDAGDELTGFATRTDTVLVIATSVSENAGTETPQTVRWSLRLDVAEVDGELAISGLERIR